MSLPVHKPQIVTDGGPWATHDYACPVCRTRHAILNLNTGIMQPCGTCARLGYELIKHRRGAWLRRGRRTTCSEA